MTWSVGAGLEGKAVLVTGAAGGIGRATAAAFAECGAHVAAHDLDLDGAQATVAELAGDGHLALGGDLREPETPVRLVAEVRAACGRLDVLAHLAAVLVRREHPRDTTVADIDLQQEVNTRATFLIGREAAETMRAQGGGGRIVNIASQAWWTGGFGGSIVYAGTKGAIVSMTRGFARTYGGDGILVNAIAPGAVDTPMLTDGLAPEAYEQFLAQIPIGRVADPSELASVVVFLASDHASYISGATLNVSGGQLMY